ncbi:olfactory receptor 11A1-like, partial [Bombina bombina]|uniref:olfactory receptor 11A1-like n=1 Tax=Bombina bombina TaxID=8345 RepID=UPI00235AF13D
MSLENKTFVIDFLLVGFKDLNSLKLFLFFLFSIIYIFTLSGNLLIIVLVLSSSRLHSPMYFFITNLSLSEVIFTTNIIPNMLENLLMGDNKISVPGCLTQYYIFSSTATTECFLLAIMSYDRYLAICNPLRYASFMDPTVCNHLVIWAWLVGFFISMITLILLCELYYCGPNEIDNFFCDLTPLIELACSDTLVVEIESFLFASVITLLPFVFIIISYSLIIYTIMKIPSTTGRKKAFSTCSSHLAVVCTYYGTLIALYVSPSKRKTFNLSKVLSLLYTIVTPLLNPIIYSLRNKEIKKEITKIV